MKLNMSRFLLCLAFTSCGGSGDKAPTSKLANSVFQSSINGQVYHLGNGYSAKTGKILNNECIVGEKIEVASPKLAREMKFIEGATYRQIVDAFNAFEKGSLSIGSKIAKSKASSELSTTLLAYTSLIGKSQTMLASGKKMGSAGLSAADKKGEEYCGTDYINEIDYGATLAVLVEISASSLEDKQKINGLLKFSSDGTIEVDEQLKKYVENNSKNYNIKISFNQMGGKSQMSLWPASPVCFAGNFDPCLIAVNKLLKYMKTGFNTDFESNPEFWVPMKYKTVSYGKEPGFERLVLAKLTDKQEELLTKAQQNIFEAYEVTIRDQKDSTLMKNSILADAKASALDQVIQATLFNAYALEKIAAKCSDSFQYCIDKASNPKEMGLRTYNNHFRKL